MMWFLLILSLSLTATVGYMLGHTRSMPRWHARDQITARDMNKMSEAIEILLKASVGTGMMQIGSSAGTGARPFHLTAVRIGKTSGTGIPAMSGTTPGYANDIAWYEFNGINLVQSETGPCFNLSSNANGNSKFIIALEINGMPFSIFESC